MAPNMKLKRILGFTTNGRNSFISQPQSGNLIYIAGCVVVILNPQTKTQNHLLTKSKQNITTLTISDDGSFLAAADCGIKATVYIWDLTNLKLIAELKAHNYEVSCMAFSANNQLLVTVGSQQDMILSLWDWRRQQWLATHKTTTKIRAISFSADSSYFVTVGEDYVKYWYIQLIAPANSNDSGADVNYSTLSSAISSITITCRSATLGEQKKNSFCDVKCGRGPVSNSTYCITKSGLLCELNSKRLLHKWVDLRTTSANCLDLGQDLIVIGCANGVARCFNSKELRFLKNIPRPHNLGIDISPRKTGNSSVPQGSTYPSIISIGLTEDTNTISCIYNDRSMYVWDLTDLNSPIKKYSALYHSSCIWGIDMYPYSTGNPLLPASSFITCSSDDTLRIWDPKVYSSKLLRKESTLSHENYKKNQFSDELIKIIFTDSTYKYLCDLDCTESKVDQNYDSNEGLRCLKISPNGEQLAVGSRSGAIRIFDFEKDSEIKNIAAHDAEVLCLEYSDPIRFYGYYYLASSSRDKLIHIFDASNNYSFLQTIDDHVSSITAIRFVDNRARDSLQLVSCGADQRIIFRNGIESGSGQLNFVTNRIIEGKNTFYDMEVDSESSCLMTACQDRMVRLFNVAQVKYQSGFKGSASDEGTLIKIALDPSCTFLAASSTDKSINIYDYQRGESIASISLGLSDLVTDLKFSHDGRYLIACTGDGCIFVWSSPAEIANAIGGNMSMVHLSLSSCSIASADDNQIDEEITKINEIASKDIKLKSLPSWAKRQMMDELDRNEQSPTDGQLLNQRRHTNDSMFEPFTQDNYTAISSKLDADYQVQTGLDENGYMNVVRTDIGEYRNNMDGVLTSPANNSYNEEISSQYSTRSSFERSPKKSTASRYTDSKVNSSKTKSFQSRENLDRISTREKFLTESLVLKDNSNQAQTNNSSLSGLFNTRTPEQRMIKSEISNLDDDKDDLAISPYETSKIEVRRSSKNSTTLGQFSPIIKVNGLSKSSNDLNNANHDSSGDELSSNDDQQQVVDSQSGRNSQTTPSQANILKQMRRNACESNQARSQESGGYNHSTGNYMGATVSSRAKSVGSRKMLIGQSSTLGHHSSMRSSRSECNLESYGNIDSRLDFSNSSHNVSSLSQNYVLCEKLDLSKSSPTTVAISQELCQYVVEELQAISKYATRLHQRLQANGSRGLSNLLARGVHNSMDILSIVPPRALHHQQCQSQINLSPVSMFSKRKLQPTQQQQRRLPSAMLGTLSAGHKTPTTAQVSGGGNQSQATSQSRANEPARQQRLKSQVNQESASSGKTNGRATKSGATMNIDQVLEAYSDRLFKMVQQRMVEQSAPNVRQVNANLDGSERPPDSRRSSGEDKTLPAL